MRYLVALILVSQVWALPAAAATVRVQVVDEDGSPVERTRVVMSTLSDKSQGEGFARRYRSQTSDTAGRAEFADIEPGQYVFEARTADNVYVESGDNPLARPVRVTVDRADQEVEVQLELHRGTTLCTRFVIGGSRLDAAGRVLGRELENGVSSDWPLGREEERCRQLFAGAWELRIEAPSGYVLVDLDVNGVSTDGHVANVDVRPGSKSQYVTWYFAALARIEGRVHFEDDPFGLQIQAQLVEAGAWREEADRRGGSRYDPVIAIPEPITHDYAMDLPDGRWRLTAVGNGLSEADPAEVEIVLARGEQRRQDFVVRGESSGSRPGLSVAVYEPDRDRAEDAVVELWPVEVTPERGAQPAARERTSEWGRAQFTKLEPGDYRLVAGHADFHESSRTITFDPEDPKSRLQAIGLEAASELKVRLQPIERQVSTPRVRMQAHEPPVSRLADETLLAALEAPSAEFDATNRAWVRGIYPGTYTVTGSAGDAFLEFQQDGGWVERIELTFGTAESVDLQARVVPAATISGRIFCKGGEPLPSTAELWVVPDTVRAVDPLDLSWRNDATLRRELLLGGARRDAFVVGPLEPSGYLLALQPSTFDRWTWAVGTENPDDAQSLAVVDGKELELGEIGIECGPAIRLTLEIQSGRPAPDLSNARGSGDVELQSTIVTAEGLRYEDVRPTVERFARLLTLRGLREGAIEGQVGLRHRYFVPEPWVRLAFTGELERGRTLALTLAVADVGGAIEVLDGIGLALAARAIDSAGGARLETLQGSRVEFDNVPVGEYRVQLCADAACTTVLHEWNPVQVELLETLELRTGTPSRDRQ